MEHEIEIIARIIGLCLEDLEYWQCYELITTEEIDPLFNSNLASLN